ncbi:transcriptional regulator, Nlp family [Thiohalospira halophila DSM 15071]|uniref:Transcriptional regulator, Nlp family n=1 Tax=Thiohalospira halophila DSM 15071 TaxID=1123397 RepID=A0A1I1MYX4_9GAMM|nr:helix-turn-helix domain-containing protein [Thiohalospira halophila]SFC90296.1 transcriptional regulator, Nlp family [Thiohalospira halophila DSM 15071]
MADNLPHKDILTDPHLRRAWIRQQLADQGLTLADVASELGISPQATYKALLTPSRRVEVALAGHLGMQPQELFPERYDEYGINIAFRSPRTDLEEV